MWKYLKFFHVEAFALLALTLVDAERVSMPPNALDWRELWPIWIAMRRKFDRDAA